MKLTLAAGLAYIAPAIAQQGAWAQCGGKNWTGGTSCIDGWTCQYQNEWYSQCLPASATTTLRTTTTSTSSTTSTTTSTTTATIITTITTTTTTTIPARPIPTKSGLDFVIDGQKGYFAGTNTYWIGFLTSNADIDGVLAEVKASGLKILRIWGFNVVNSIPNGDTVYYQALVPGQAPFINTGANGLQRLDYVVRSAEAHGIKLIINFNNIWSDYGGVPAYNNYFGTTQRTWYTDAAAQATYKDYIKAVISRYPTSPAIFAWELMNEPRCQGCSTDIIYNWAHATSAYIKSLDSNHMVTLGDEGFGVNGGDGSYPFQLSEGLNFTKNLEIPTLDFGVFHMYPESWGVDLVNFPALWIETHAASCSAAGKPCLFEEYGYKSDHIQIEKPWQEKALATRGTASDLFWQLGTVLASGSRTHDDTNTIYTDGPEWGPLVTDHVAAVRSKNGF